MLEDKKYKFTSALEKFNEGKSKDAIKKVEHDIIYDNSTSLATDIETSSSEQSDENEDITFLRNVITILSQKYKLDSQGLFEYVKEIVDIKLGPESRSKIWKEIKLFI